MIKKQRTEAAYELVLHSADVNAVGEHGNTPLHFAVMAGNLQLIKVTLFFQFYKQFRASGIDTFWSKLQDEERRAKNSWSCRT
jgi:hypothetical protein